MKRFRFPRAVGWSLALLGVAVLPLGAQLTVRGSAECFAPVSARGDQAAIPAPVMERERARALADIDSGRYAAAVERLERVARLDPTERVARLDPTERMGAATPLAELAFAYQRLGCRQAFVATGERVLREGAGNGFAERFRVQSAVAAAQRLDSLAPDGLVIVARDDSLREGVLSDLAWSHYRAGRFADAVRAFAQLAAVAPGLGSRLDARLMMAQASLELGRSDSAAAQFHAVADSARMVRAAFAATDGRWQMADDGNGRDGVAELGALLAERRTAELLWAPDVRDGRLLVSMPDSGRRTMVLRAVQSADVSRRLDALGGAALSTPLRALVWTRVSTDSRPLRDAVDSLALADVRVRRSEARLALLAAERAERLADAGRYKAGVTLAAQDLRVFDAQMVSFEDSLARQDSGVAAGIRQYRQTVLNKIADVRSLARRNQNAIDSIASEAGPAGAVPAHLVSDERSAATSYLETADAASGALEAGLQTLPIVFARDTVRAKVERFRRTLAATHRSWDSTLVAAAEDERRIAAEVDARLADANVEQGLAVTAREAVQVRLATAATAALRARAATLDAQLARAGEAAEFGAGTASFFAAIAADTVRGVDRQAAALRDTAIADLDGAIARHKDNPLRARALVQLGELYARKADADYAAAQRANIAVDHPDYTAAMARFDTLLKDFPRDAEADAAAYTLGSLAFLSQKYDESFRAFERVMAAEGSRFRAESFFRAGDARFEMASKQSAEARRALLAQAAQYYDRAIALAPAQGDIYFLSLYKLGWSNYAQAERQNSDEYRRAVDVFARLVREMDELPKARASALALRQEAIDYLAIAITQMGGAEEAVRYVGLLPEKATRLLVLKRLARALRDQGEFASASIAYREVLGQQPDDPLAMETYLEAVDLYQNRMLEPARAQEARLQLVDALAPGAPWGRANAARAADAAAVRERALRESGAWALGEARKTISRAPGTPGAQSGASTGAPGTPAFAAAAALAARYLGEFSRADSAQRVSALEAEALFGAGEFLRSGAAFSRTAVQWTRDSALAAVARRNAIVAFDSALARAPRDTALQDSLFTATDRFTALASDADARSATVAKGRRAAEGQRWNVVAATFGAYSKRWPDEPFAVDARKLVGDARYRLGQYQDAQREWLAAQTLATQSGRKALADSIAGVRLSAATQAADSLGKAGQYAAAADEVFTALAADIGDPVRAADMLRSAIEMHLAADSAARARNDKPASLAARTAAILAVQRLAAAYPAYPHTITYRALRAQLLSDVGRAAESVDALNELIQSAAAWPARADGMVRVAVLLDSLGRHGEAAGAYERFSVAYPADKRAADAQYNAAVLSAETGDKAGAARAYAAFIARFPRDARVGAAQHARLSQLQAAGDSATATAELAKLCVKPGEAFATVCAERAGSGAFREGMAGWDRYAAMVLEIKTRSQLTRAGVDAASAPKLLALRQLTAQFTRAIASGAPEWIAAGSFQTGLAQWHYGMFLRDVQLPADLTDAQREAARRGSAQQAQAYFDLAVKTWTALVAKAAADKFDNEWVARARQALEGDGIPAREEKR